MNILYAIFLGALQGATEFLPISSSGHLALAEIFLGLREAGLTFDVGLHLGTLLAILVYFRDDFLTMGKSLLPSRTQETRKMRHLLLFLCLATVPGGLAGVIFGHAAETTLRQPWLIAGTLSFAGLLLLWAEKAGSRRRGFQTIALSDALLIGLSQALAIIPGVSRSGITITAGLMLGLDRQAVVRFSFLLSAPIILGAGVYKIPAIISQGLMTDQLGFYCAGFAAAAGSGYLFIAFLMRYVRTRSFAVFAYYRFILSALTAAALLLR